MVFLNLPGRYHGMRGIKKVRKQKNPAEGEVTGVFTGGEEGHLSIFKLILVASFGLCPREEKAL